MTRRRELELLAAAIALGIAIRLVYAFATRHFPLAGDEPEYDAEGVLIAHGHLFWTRLPYGILHAGAWKAPGYPAWVGFWYALVGHHEFAVKLAQVPLGALTIALSWLLARRLFGPKAAAAAAFLVAIYPFAFQYEELLYSEALATPLTLAVLIAIFTKPPSRKHAAATGALLGMLLLIRPSSAFLILGALVAWAMVRGWRNALALTAVAALTAALVLAPWTIRNAVVLHGFLPIAVDDAALYGTFNAQSANDPIWPYAWRPDPLSVQAIFDPRHPLKDIELHGRLMNAATTYIEQHPASLAEAFYWNGLSRLWDIRHRSRSLAEVPFEGRSRLLTNLGLDLYDVLLPLALVGLWRARRRRELVWGVLAIALGASIVFTGDSGTRYRATIEPLIAVMACAGVLGERRPKQQPTTQPAQPAQPAVPSLA